MSCVIARLAPGTIEYIADQLTAGGINFIATSTAHRNHITGFLQQAAKAINTPRFGTSIVRSRKRVKRNKIDLTRHIAQQSSQLTRLGIEIIDPLNQGVFDGHHALAIGQTGHVIARRAEQLGNGVFTVDRDQFIVRSERGVEIEYDTVVLATGSYPFVPPT